jgi:Ca2+-binding RTX toxin-like protein
MTSSVKSLSPEPIDYNFETDPGEFTIQKGTHQDDILTGTDGRDWLLGRGGDDILVAKGGRDYLEGGNGNDILSGDGNYWDEERFAFDKDDGNDTITDFVPQCEICIQIFPGPEGDDIVLLGGTQEDIDAVTKGVTENPTGDAVLHYGETTITLAGIEASAVKAEWFLLG